MLQEIKITVYVKHQKVVKFYTLPLILTERRIVVTVYLRALQKLKKLRFDADFSEISIKGRGSGGNILSKNPIKKIDLKSGVYQHYPR